MLTNTNAHLQNETVLSFLRLPICTSSHKTQLLESESTRLGQKIRDAVFIGVSIPLRMIGWCGSDEDHVSGEIVSCSLLLLLLLLDSINSPMQSDRLKHYLIEVHRFPHQTVLMQSRERHFYIPSVQ